ncbi:hotdog family protein [Porticoccus sp. W117]|uniref:hotdog family protein n=1 Tax=Porticoccus sp. W117 TaxID=3054777 RepID=UPI0025933A28|nr:hotdog family protein [Porticoccus sp. W117]MDM3869845.1 hotdog family protein [Porticoccus sp. W117]
MSEFWPVDELVPHGGDMILLDEVLESRDKGVTVALSVREDGLFDVDGRVPAWLGIEYMAQTIAAFAGIRAKKAGEPVKLGFLVGTRRYQSPRDHFRCGEQLTVNVDEVLCGENGLSVFECEINGDGYSLTANLNVFQPEDVEQFLEQQ